MAAENPTPRSRRHLIFGSRGYCDPVEVAEYVLSLPPGTIVVTGLAEGVDAWAANVAHFVAGLETEDHPVTAAEWASRGKGAGPMRNSHMAATKPDSARGFWNGTSNGTRDMARKVVKTGCPVELMSRASRADEGELLVYDKGESLGAGWRCKGVPCVPQMHNGRILRTNVVDALGSQGIVYCSRCRWQIPELELMKAAQFRLVSPGRRRA